MTRIIPFILYLVLIAGHEVIIKDATTIFSVTVNLPGLLVLLVAIYKPELVSTWFGFAAGLVMAAAQPNLIGWYALALAALGSTAFHFRERLNLESLYAKLALIVGGIVIHNTLLLLINGGQEFFFLFLVGALPGAVFTTVLAWVFFLFKEKRITYQKVKKIF